MFLTDGPLFSFRFLLMGPMHSISHLTRYYYIARKNTVREYFGSAPDGVFVANKNETPSEVVWPKLSQNYYEMIPQLSHNDPKKDPKIIPK